MCFNLDNWRDREARRQNAATREAIKLMDGHKLTLSEIAFEVGFNSASYFTRCFKEEYGKTPSEYLDHA